MAMDIGNSFQYPSRDKDWVVKVLIGGVLNIIPIANLIASGYVLTLMARSMDRLQEEMPKWDDWGGYLMKGLMVAVISLIYCVIPLGVMMIGLLPMIAGAVMERSGGAAAVGVGVGVGILMVVVGALLFIPVLLIMPMAIMVYARTENFSAAFAFGEIIEKIKVNLGDYVIILVVALVAGAALGIVAGAIPVLGFLVSMLGGFYLACVVGYLFGNYFRENFCSDVMDAAVVEAPMAATPVAENPPTESAAPPEPGA